MKGNEGETTITFKNYELVAIRNVIYNRAYDLEISGDSGRSEPYYHLAAKIENELNMESLCNARPKVGRDNT